MSRDFPYLHEKHRPRFTVAQRRNMAKVGMLLLGLGFGMLLRWALRR